MKSRHPLQHTPSIYNTGTVKSASSRHDSPQNLWRDEDRFFMSSPSSPLFDSKVRWCDHKTTPELRQPLNPHPLRAYCRLASPPLLTQPSQHLPIVVPRVHCEPWSPLCGMAALFGVRHHRIVSTKITRPSTLLPFCSHLYLLFTARPLPTFPA